MRSGSSATGNSFSNLVGTGSNRHVVGLDAVIRLFSSFCPIVVKHSSFSLGGWNNSSARTITWGPTVNISNTQHARYKEMVSNIITLRYDIYISKINSMRYN